MGNGNGNEIVGRNRGGIEEGSRMDQIVSLPAYPPSLVLFVGSVRRVCVAHGAAAVMVIG